MHIAPGKAFAVLVVLVAVLQGAATSAETAARGPLPVLLSEAAQATAVVSPVVPPSTEVAPDAMLASVTTAVAASLRAERGQKSPTPGKVSEIVQSMILPLFNFQHMTQFALGRNWRLATPEQQGTLVAEFTTLLVRTYSAALTNYRDQPIEYKPLRLAPGDTDVTVRSSVKQTASQRVSIDYDMEKTLAGWKVYDVKIGGISLITTYQSNFAQLIQEGGVAKLIHTLAEKNRPTGGSVSSDTEGATVLLFVYTVMPGLLGDRR